MNEKDKFMDSLRAEAKKTEEVNLQLQYKLVETEKENAKLKDENKELKQVAEDRFIEIKRLAERKMIKGGVIAKLEKELKIADEALELACFEIVNANKSEFVLIEEVEKTKKRLLEEARKK